MLTPMPFTQLFQATMSDITRRSALASVVLASVALCSCDQPDPGCITTTNAFAVKLITMGEPVESAPGACTGFGPSGFNALPEIGVSPYFAIGSDGQPDYDRGSIAIQTAEIGTFFYTAQGFDVGNAVDGEIYSLGAFASPKPDANNFCTVPELSPTRVVLPELAAIPDDPTTEDDTPFSGQPPVDATLEWSDVRVYVTADTFGTQLEAALVDTRINEAGESCTYTYRALGLAPAVACGATDAEGAPLFNDDGSPVLAPELCEPEADLAAGRPLGSGISPSARYECDPISAFCVIQGTTVPALR
jgi:hypothetical protein